MLLQAAHDHLHWPAPAEIWHPPGAGPRIYADLASRKIGQAHCLRKVGARVGVLAAEPGAQGSETPIAVVCEFPREPDEGTLSETHRLAWNFCRSPLLITADPASIRAWSCQKLPPLRAGEGLDSVVEAGGDEITRPSSAAARALSWLQLASGAFFTQDAHRRYFSQDERADSMLLSNLEKVRDRLRADGLDDDIAHALLGRIIFAQFLFDRKDEDGRSALNPEKLASLRREAVLSRKCETLGDVLRDHADAYAFFAWLNDKFNGDLFPGKGSTEAERHAEWRSEREAVTEDHLGVLADFVSGELDMGRRQHCLWRQYAFDVIPLEFTSCIYESFVPRGQGRYYTRPHLVDFVLDEVLPWDDDRWDLRILDPACGSGAFLVRAFQRLVHRWKRANPSQKPTAALLRGMLERNLTGVDLDRHAVRVASFSLYLAMCDEIDPRHYWTQVRFPRLRDVTIHGADFFDEDQEGYRTGEDAGTFDLVVGNAPWGRGTQTDACARWAQDHGGWPIPDKQAGPLFLAKAAALAKPDGRVSMLQSSGVLWHKSGPARRLRQRLFERFRVHEVVNLAARRWVDFGGRRRKGDGGSKSIAPVCLITLSPEAPDGDPIPYCVPKVPQGTWEQQRIVTDPTDFSYVHQDEAVTQPWIWSALAAGGRRDVALLRRLRVSPTLASLDEVVCREGIIASASPAAQVNERIVGMPLVGKSSLAQGSCLRLDPRDLPRNMNPRTHRSTSDLRAFSVPQLLVAQSCDPLEGLLAVRVAESGDNSGVLCTQSYVSFHVDAADGTLLDVACLAYNSIVADYWLFMTSGRLAFYRPEAEVGDICSLPLPAVESVELPAVRDREHLNALARQAYCLGDLEWALVEDAVQFALRDIHTSEAPGHQSTRSCAEGLQEPDLSAYCEYLLRVLQASLDHTHAHATIFRPAGGPLPLRLVAVHFDAVDHPPVSVKPVDDAALEEQLYSLDRLLGGTPAAGGGLVRQRVARVYDASEADGVTAYIVKPDQRRFWSRSAGMRDADSMIADIMAWQGPDIDA